MKIIRIGFAIVLAVAALSACRGGQGFDTGAIASSTGEFEDHVEGGWRKLLDDRHAAMGLASLKDARGQGLHVLRLSTIETLGLPLAFTLTETGEGSATGEIALLSRREPETEARFAQACARAATLVPPVRCTSARVSAGSPLYSRFGIAVAAGRAREIFALAEASPLCEPSPPSELSSDQIVMDGDTLVAEIAGRGRYCATQRDNRAPRDLEPLFRVIDAETQRLESLFDQAG